MKRTVTDTAPGYRNRRRDRWLVAGLCAALLWLPASSSFAEEQDDPAFMQYLFAPDLILGNSRAIGLTKTQKRQMVKAMKKTQVKATEHEYSVFEAALDLEDLAAADPIDEEAMVKAAQQIFVAEGLVKEQHLRLLIRLRNLLDEKQREQLRKIRDDG